MDGLRAACLREREIEIKEPRLVGVDPLGFDVRGRFDVVRLDSPTVMTTEEDARLVLGKKTAS